MRGNRRQNQDAFDRSTIILVIGVVMVLRMYLGGSVSAQEAYEAEVRNEEALIEEQY